MNFPKLKIVDEIKVWWKLWSIRLGIIGTTLATTLIAFPDWAVGLWSIMPDDVRQAIPPQYMPLLGVGVFVMSMIARFIKQHKVGEALAIEKAKVLEQYRIELETQERYNKEVLNGPAQDPAP